MNAKLTWAIALCLITVTVWSEDKPTATETQTDGFTMPVYRPPEGAESGIRVNGTHRGKSKDVPSLFVLAPDHVGLTLQQQPDLFWYQSKPSNVQFELSMGTDTEPEPVLSVAKPKATDAGIVRIDLRKHNVRLEKDVEYRWSVALVVDPENRSRDVIASGFIRRTAPDVKLSTRLVQQNPRKTLQVLADFGIWYDALATLSSMIDQEPKNRALRQWRAQLLDQVDLTEPATFDQTP